ncbi:MAG: M20/M25/M40 family metallo-hydrolase, partial [bacterium]
MWRAANAFVAAAVVAAAAWALPGDLVVISDREVTPDEAAGLCYLGQAGDGYLYNGSSAAVGRVAPYRVLDRGAQLKDYYIVWAPEWVGLTPQAFAHLGAAVRLSEYEILVGLERGLGPGALRAVEHRIELIKLEPVTPVDWRYDGEAPPAKKDLVIEWAINAITKEEYARYIRTLENFKTRYTDTTGSREARDYIRSFFAAHGLQASVFPFKLVEFEEVYYAGAPGHILILTNCDTFKRTRDGGVTWDTICAEPTNTVTASFWLTDNVGFVLGVDPKNNLVKTTDGGTSWETLSSIRLAFGVGVMYFAGTVTGWLGGKTNRGFILKTADGGKTWHEQKIPADFGAVEKIDFFDANRGWAASSNAILYTDDGGSTWRECNLPAASIADLAATGTKEAWAASATEKLLHTEDGLTWTWFDLGLGSYFSHIEFPDSTHGFAAGGKLIATADGGVTWKEVTTAPQMGYGLFSFADRLRGVVGDWTGDTLYRTDDGGKTFVNIIKGIDLNEYNVIGERRGTEAADEIVIIGGHFDSVSEQVPSLAPGADDNASGTACAMAAARAFRGMSFKRTVRYVAFGAEEHGLIGSKAYADHCAQKGEKIVAFLNADMVCYDEESGRRDDYAVDYGRYAWLFDYLKTTGGLYGNNLIYESGSCGSDQKSFWDMGYAAMGVIEGEVGPGGGQEYPYYHGSMDTLDKLHPEL